MKLTNKDFFKFYVYNTINDYWLYSKYVPIGNNYKEYKIIRVIEYLGIKYNPNNIFIKILTSISFLEVPLSHLLELWYFFKCLLLKSVTSKKDTGKQLIMFARGAFVDFSVLNKSHINVRDVEFVTSPLSNNKMYEECEKLSLLAYVSFYDLLNALVNSMRMTCYLPIKYGKRDCFFRSYSAFEYFMVCYAFCRIDNNKTVLFTSLNDRWAYIFGHLPNNKIFIQHGAAPLWFSIVGKIGTTNVGYYFNKEQKNLCNKVMFTNIPECKFMELMIFTGNESLKDNGKKNVLLVCYQLFFEKEKIIIDKLCKNSAINVYIKPHPTDNEKEKYYSLQDEYGFDILDKTDYPKVDIVVSYESTLALEYRMAGVKTLLYEDPDFDFQFKELIDFSKQ